MINYKNVCENELSRLKSIINALADIRDSFEEKSTQEKFFQGQIDSIASLKNEFEREYMNAQIEETKNKI